MDNKLYRLVPCSDRLPNNSERYKTDKGELTYFPNWKSWQFDYKPEWWLEEIELPSEKEIYFESGKKSTRTFLRFIDGANFILNHIKK